MGRLTALNPLYLIGVGAALIPLIIHLIERRRVQRVVFGSIWFLRGMVRRLARRRRTSELILLILRMAVLVFLALAFSRPFFRPAGATGEGDSGGAKAAAVLVDVSASMKIGSRMAEAKKHALSVIDRLQTGDQVAVYAFGIRLDTVTAWTAEHGAARSAITELKAGDQGTDLADALRQVGEAIAEIAAASREITVCSDMQAAGWDNYRGEWQLPRGVALALVDVGGDKTPPNVGIVKLGVSPKAVVGSEPEVLTVQVRNYSDERREVIVTLKLGGEAVEKREISLPARESSSVSFRHLFEAPGQVAGEFSLDVEDKFSADNRVSFVLQVEPKIRVLLVNGSDAAAPKDNDGYFVKRALAPSPESIFQVEEVSPASWKGEKLDGAAAVVLTDVTTLSDAAMRKLRAHVEGGGGVMFFLGTRTRPAAFNRLFAEVAPCRLDERIDVPRQGIHREGLVIGEVDTQHPIFQPFGKPHHGDFTRVHFRSYFSVTHSQAAQVLARFDNKKPAVLIKRIGKGESLLVVSSADLEMNDFCLRAVFLPFVHQSVKLLAAHGRGRETLTQVGAELMPELPDGVTSARLTTPSGASRDLVVARKEGGAEGAGTAPRNIVGFPADEQGIYKLSFGGTEMLFAANLDETEGDLVKLQPDEVAAALTARRGEPRSGTGVLHAGTGRLRDEEIARNQRIAWVLLIFAVVLLAAEMMLADRIARQE